MSKTPVSVRKVYTLQMIDIFDAPLGFATIMPVLQIENAGDKRVVLFFKDRCLLARPKES